MTERHSPPLHGTRSRYNNWGCRCEACTAANRERTRALIAERQAKPLPEHVTHGTATAYTNYGCRCVECRAWSRDDARAKAQVKRDIKES